MMTNSLEALIASIKDTIDDAARLYGDKWDSALVGGEPNYHAITSEKTNDVVVRTSDDSRESSWLCDYLESVSPANVKVLIAALEQAQQELRDVERSGCGYIFTCKPVTPAADERRVIKLYTIPPLPAVPDEITSDNAPEVFEIAAEAERLGLHGAYASYAVGWNACRAAMLQGSEPVTTAYKLPMQPLVVDSRGTLRFKENTLVRKLLDFGTEHGYGLNQMAVEDFTPEDRMQLAQLIGYSLSGYGTLSYVTDESYDRAIAASPQLPGNTR
jgi:hypothetical protein